MIKNGRLSSSSHPYMLTEYLIFKPVDKDILNGYNKQFPHGYQYKDEHRNKIIETMWHSWKWTRFGWTNLIAVDVEEELRLHDEKKK